MDGWVGGWWVVECVIFIYGVWGLGLMFIFLLVYYCGGRMFSEGCYLGGLNMIGRRCEG